MSQNFNIFEKYIARLLTRAPAIKRKVKHLYSIMAYALNKKDYKHRAELQISTIRRGNEETFFGYYDKSPDNGNGLVLVNMSSASTKSLPRNVSSIQLNVFCMKRSMFILENDIELLAFNWQQGARAHWLNSDLFVFNNFDMNIDAYCTYIYSVSERKLINKINYPVQDSYKDEYMLSLSYELLTELRPDYGYFKHDFTATPSIDEAGIWMCDYRSNTSKFLFSVRDICNFKFDYSYTEFRHKLNHIMISPGGDNFIFMHRYYDINGQRFDRLILADRKGELISLLADNQMVSHCYWFNDNTILGYLRNNSGLDDYWLIDIHSGEYKKFSECVFQGRGDGHPSVKGELIITDTYPDKSRMQGLYLTTNEAKKELKLGEFYHGFDFSGETRCDLHPRFSSKGDYIFFDTVYSGQRQLCYFDINATATKIKKNV